MVACCSNDLSFLFLYIYFKHFCLMINIIIVICLLFIFVCINSSHYFLYVSRCIQKRFPDLMRFLFMDGFFYSPCSVELNFHLGQLCHPSSLRRLVMHWLFNLFICLIILLLYFLFSFSFLIFQSD